MLIVRKGLAGAGIYLGVFGPIANGVPETQNRATKFANGSTNGHAEDRDDVTVTTEDADGEDAEGDDDERQSRPVIKLRTPRHRQLSRSRSRRRDLASVAEDDSQPVVPDTTDLDSVANIRFSAHIYAKSDINALMPFALITPENKKRRRRQKPMSGQDSPATPTGASTVAHTATSTEDDQENQAPDSALPPVSLTPTLDQNAVTKQLFLQGTPADMKGVFVRKFRWGTVDVLDPKHCDFAAFRTAILSTHLKVRAGFGDDGSDRRLT
jgi:hypothetical protein